MPRPHHQSFAALSRSDLVLNFGAVEDSSSGSRDGEQVRHTVVQDTCKAQRGRVSPCWGAQVIANPHCSCVGYLRHFPLVDGHGGLVAPELAVDSTLQDKKLVIVDGGCG